MTEPPQPPNQPPTPSGYGHLPGPPQPGYGYPPEGANPYAQQPPTVQQQPAYNYPPPPPGAPAMPPGAPGTPPKKKATALIAAAVAGVLVLGAGTYFAFFRGDDKDPKPPVAQESTSPDAKPSGSPSIDKGDGSGNGGGDADINSGRKQGEDKVLWLKTVKIDGPAAGVHSEGQWVVGDAVVKVVDKAVTGYAVADGKQKWTLSLPAAVCAVTRHTTADGKTVVMYRDGESTSANCNQMRLIDLKTGKEGWSKEVPKEGAFDLFIDPRLAITGDIVTVSRLSRASAFKLSTGDKLFASPTEGCMPGAYPAGSGKILGIATCHDADSTVEVQDIDPATGKSTWSYRLPKGWKVNRVFSLDPIVLDLGNKNNSKERSIVVLGPDGKQRATVTGEGSFSTECGMNHDDSLQGCATAVVDAGTLYMPTTTDLLTANEVVAFDLGTGKAKWRVPAGDMRTIVPLKAANGQLVIYRSALDAMGGEVLTIPAGGGTPTAVLRHPSGPAAEVESTFYSPEVDYVDGRFFISAIRLQAQGKDEKFLMVFGK
ncbi:PQQ-like beta-propeller repeat protein [Streptomyces sp. NBC_00555]|uniref:outer membrane protein assembly factor BamB family protein n=1 Tax=Streptomyces sp. NBC_00555 TaxID=2903662 RepID=UPI00225602DA|nr:PQQ-binding-like beta-propeller repeat protein [Streptomyces sp. NBC_00555]MCX5013526.1 PQQ-like beta-propeller repeat protein [Streptomyces sp. NBC_00555]